MNDETTLTEKPETETNTLFADFLRNNSGLVAEAIVKELRDADGPLNGEIRRAANP